MNVRNKQELGEFWNYNQPTDCTRTIPWLFLGPSCVLGLPPTNWGMPTLVFLWFGQITRTCSQMDDFPAIAEAHQCAPKNDRDLRELLVQFSQDHVDADETNLGH